MISFTAMSGAVIKPLLFPCLIAAGRDLLRTTKRDALKFLIKRHLHGNRLLLRCGASPEDKVSFFIDRTGSFRRVQVLDRRRSWALPLAWFWDFTLLECEISPGTMMTMGELDEALKPLKKSGHFPAAGNFHRFLRRHAAEDLFDEAKFRQFWEKYGPPLSDSEWTEHYP